MSKPNEHFEQKNSILFVDDDARLDMDTIEQDAQACISIETKPQEEEHEAVMKKDYQPHPHKWRWIALGIIASTLLCILSYGGWRLYNYYYNIGVPISVSPDENIAKLQKVHAKGTKPEIILTADSILGVALNMYELRNLQAELSLTEPDTTDTSVWMYSRCADHTSDNQYLGSFVMKGKELASDKSRLGYCGMANGNIVIGVSRSDKVKDYVMEQKGSFFRQFILVSNGVLPAKFQLHGKVERRALARMSNDKLYYIETRHPETLWDFADALREYGFVDAIYITGGKCHSFYRTPDGKPHNIGDTNQHPHLKYQKIVPWMIFKER